MRIKVKTELFPKDNFFMGWKAPWLSIRAYVETLATLNELSGRVLTARLEGKEEIFVNGKEASAIVIYLFHTKDKENDKELLSLFEALKEESKERKEKIVKILPENLIAYLKSKGIEVNEDKVKTLVEKALKAIKEKRLEVSPEADLLGEMLFYSFKLDQTRNVNEIGKVFSEDLLNKVKDLYDQEKKEEKEYKKENLYKRLRKIEESVAYLLFSSSYALGEYLKSGEEVFVLKDKNKGEVKRLTGILTGIVQRLELSYNPEAKFSIETFLELNARAMEAVENNSVKELIKELEKEYALPYHFVKTYNEIAGTNLTARDLAEMGVKVPSVSQEVDPSQAEEVARKLAEEEWEKNLPQVKKEEEVKKEISELGIDL